MRSDIDIFVNNQTENLRELTISGVSWTTVVQIIKQLVTFSFSVLLARILNPNDFGLMGMIIVFTGFVYLFGDMGFGASIIQRENISRIHLSSVFWLNLFIGLLLSVIMFFCAKPIADFYNEVRLIPILRLISINIALQPIGVIQNSILMRNMKFKKLGLIELASIFTSGLLAIYLSLNGFGVYSLVWQVISASLVKTLLLWVTTRWLPGFTISFSAIKQLFGFSSNLLGFNVINYWLRNGDNLLIGKYMGAIELGFYSRSYSVMLLPLTQVTSVISKVMFPSLSRIQNDLARFKRIYFQSLSMIALITFPMMTGLLVVSREFVIVLFGSKWLPIVDLLQVFSLLGLVQSILSTIGWIYQALGRTDLMFKWGIYSGVIILTSFFVGIIVGTIDAVAISYTLANFIFLLYPGFVIPLRLINSNFLELLSRLRIITLSSLLMGILTQLLKFLFPVSWSDPIRLVLCVLFGSFVYLIPLILLREEALSSLVSIIKRQIRKRVPALSEDHFERRVI